uniref:F-box domain-containing protein n=1 Tax=Zea mays TaxID=4577 RepID=A0A804MQY0_MAIZE
MRLRSGRRLVSPPVAAPRGAARSVGPPRRHTADSGDGVGEDRLSSLPLDLQLEVLARLRCARGAARTSVLSRAWRGLWTQLRELAFDGSVGPDSLAGALCRLAGERTQVRPKLRRLCIHLPGNLKLGDARISSLLHAAYKLAPLELEFVVVHDAIAPEEAGPRRSQRLRKPNPKYFGDKWAQA